EANGSASQILSSTEQPSARSTLETPESTAGTGGPNRTCSSGDQPFGHASRTTGMTSLTLPPPATEAVLVTEAGAVFAVRTVILIGGYEARGASASERVHVNAVHVQPEPEAAFGPAVALASLTSATSPVGRTSVTEADVAGASPAF